MSIGNFKSKADYDRKVSDYMKFLKLQASLNERGEKASELTQRYIEGVKPAPQPFRSTEEELADENAQRELAIENVLEAMPKRPEAASFVGMYLRTPEELANFNRNWGAFSSAIAGIQLITPQYLNTLWQKFKRQQFAGTSDVASIADLQDEVNQIALDIKAIIEGWTDIVSQSRLERAVDDAATRFDLETLRALKRQAELIVAREEGRAATERRGEARAKEITTTSQQRLAAARREAAAETQRRAEERAAQIQRQGAYAKERRPAARQEAMRAIQQRAESRAAEIAQRGEERRLRELASRRPQTTGKKKS